MSSELTVHPSNPPACCVPSIERAERLAESRYLTEQRPRATAGSTEDMVKLDTTPFLMGTETDEGFPADGEGPIREVTLNAFWIDTYPVTNAKFREFVNAASYKTEAERFGWSFVFHNQLPWYVSVHLKARLSALQGIGEIGTSHPCIHLLRVRKNLAHTVQTA